MAEKSTTSECPVCRADRTIKVGGSELRLAMENEKLRATIYVMDEEIADLKEACGIAAAEEALAREYKRRYPPDFIEKMQQDIDERDVTITGLRRELAIIEKPVGILELQRQLDDATSRVDDLKVERSSLMKILAQWYFSSMRQGWETGHTEGEVIDEIVNYFANSLHPEWPSGYDAEQTCAAVDKLTESLMDQLMEAGETETAHREKPAEANEFRLEVAVRSGVNPGDPIDDASLLDHIAEARRDTERLDWALPYLRDHGVLPLDVDGRAAIDESGGGG